ncbi:MAG: hypothetical protein ABMA26_27525 [Limisphaerales bacterium]
MSKGLGGMGNHIMRLALLLVLGVACVRATLLAAQDTKKFSYVDLQTKANAKLTGSFGSGFLNLAKLPQGELTFQEVKFKISEGLIQLGRQSPPLKEPRPDKVEGIPVKSRLAKLHLLHATVGGGLKPSQFAEDGTMIAEYKVHYEDGTTQAIPVVYGKDLRDFFNHDDFKPVERAKLAWKDNEPPLRLYLCAWENPHPAKIIRSIDFVKTGDTSCAPFCVAITLEQK